MKSKNFINQGTVAVALAMILGSAAANAKDVYLQAEAFPITVPATSPQAVRSVAISNPSFESPDCRVAGACTNGDYSIFTPTNFAGWEPTGRVGVFATTLRTPPPLVPTDLLQIGMSDGGTLSQVLSENLEASTTYTLTVDVGRRINNYSFGSYVIGLYAGGVELATSTSPTPASGGWAASTVTYTSSASDPIGQPLEIRLTGVGAQEEFDNVRLTAQSLVETVTMWGYSECTDATFGSCGAPSSPGPQIDVPNNEGLNVYLKNNLDEPTSLMIAGQKNAPLPSTATRVNGRLQSFVPEVAALSTPVAGTPTYSFPDLTPGAFLYQSGSFVAKQVQMGLYGAVVKDAVCDDAASTSPCAYGDVPYDAQQVLVFSEIDPALHNPPKAANASKTGYVPKVFLINGESVATPIATPPSSLVQIAVANPGFEFPDCDTGACTNAEYSINVVDGWTVTGTGGNVGVFDPTARNPVPLTPTEGDQMAYSDGGYLTQVLTETLAEGATYTLSVDVGARNSYAYGSYAIELYAGTTLVGTSSAPTPAAGTWETSTVTYGPVAATDTLIGQALQIRLIGVSNQEEFDNVRLERTRVATDPAIGITAGNRVLVRMINAGLENHAPQLLGGYFDVVAEDGHRSPVHRTQHTVFLPAAKSLDLIFTPSSAGVYPLFDRRLRTVTDSGNAGGMFHQIVVGGTP